jgi:hypothetical protein
MVVHKSHNFQCIYLYRLASEFEMTNCLIIEMRLVANLSLTRGGVAG